MNKKSVSPLITGLCCVAAVTAISAYTDRSKDSSTSELAAVPSENNAYEVITFSEETVSETVLSAVTEYIADLETTAVPQETPPESSEAIPEESSSEATAQSTDVSSETAPETLSETAQSSAVSENQTETSAAAAAAASDNGDFPAGDVYVILNTKTKCIHLDPGCQHAKKISDENREETYSDIAALADEGYWACSKCAGDYRDIAPKP